MEQSSQTTHTIEIKKSAQYPHLITLYRKDWRNEDAWNRLIKELDLPEDTPQVGLLLSKGGIK